LYALSQWRHEVYGIYMRVSLFGLSSRHTNLMHMSIELVQLVLPTSVYNTLLNASLPTCVYAHNMIFDTCFSKSVLSIHVCLLVHATWHVFYHSFGSFLTSLDLYVQILELGLKWILPPRIKAYLMEQTEWLLLLPIQFLLISS